MAEIVRVKATIRTETVYVHGEYEHAGTRTISTVEIVVGGVSFVTECDTPEGARALAMNTARRLGLAQWDEDHV